MTNQADNKSIAKNTMALYFRMLFTMAVSLYTSRVILNTLGVVDYGIYNVVGGIVSMFTFINGAMVTSTQRYLTYELGRGNMKKLQEVFSTSIYVHIGISLAIVLLAETVGLWFFYEKMVIPVERMAAAMWVFQLSILTMVVNVMSVPYNSAIVAHEKMSAFAIISVAEVVLKLIIVYMLVIGNFDKLKLFAVLSACLSLLIRFIYTQYSHRHFIETRRVFRPNLSLIKEMGQFAGWNLWGSMAAMLMGTGVNMLLNVFFGPVVNAARGIAVQVETSVANFSTNFLMAVNPQITKLYAQNNLKEMHTLIFRASKFAFFLMFALSLPIVMETKSILTLWLKIVPDHTVVFLRLLLVIVIINAVAKPLMTSAAATGNVKKYQSVVGSILLSIVPIAYVVLRLGGSPASVYIVYLFVALAAFLVRLIIIRPMIHLSLRQYVQHVVLRILMVTVVSFLAMLVVRAVLPSNLIGIFAVCFISVIMALLTSYALGLTTNERNFVIRKIVDIANKVKR
jgi:O-antigen/teichoic acid export membrane protein